MKMKKIVTSFQCDYGYLWNLNTQDKVFRFEHPTLYPAAVLALDLCVLGSGDASPPGGVDHALDPPLVSEGEITDNSSRRTASLDIFRLFE